MTDAEHEHRVSFRELVAAAVIGFLAGYGAVALVSHFVVGYRLTVGTLPSRPCIYGLQPRAQPVLTVAGGDPSWVLQQRADAYHLPGKGAPNQQGRACTLMPTHAPCFTLRTCESSLLSNRSRLLMCAGLL